MRQTNIERKTKETEISVRLNLDGSGKSEIRTGIGFFDHMLEQLAHHGLLDLTIAAKGDLHIDAHHTVEDCGSAIGQAISEALGDKTGIIRYASFYIPMDEALVRVALDLSGRPFLVWKLNFTREMLGDMETEMFREFFQALVRASGMTLHVEALYGYNNHHIIEACFKAFARALRQAVAIDPQRPEAIPSTKGKL